MKTICSVIFLMSIFLLPGARAAGDQVRVLFIGNSYSFQVPKMFGELARSKGKDVVVEQVTKGGWTLAKHAAAEQTRKKISGSKWDYLVGIGAR